MLRNRWSIKVCDLTHPSPAMGQIRDGGGNGGRMRPPWGATGDETAIASEAHLPGATPA